MVGVYIVLWKMRVSEAVMVGEIRFAAKPFALSLQTLICSEKLPRGDRWTPRILVAVERSKRLT